MVLCGKPHCGVIYEVMRYAKYLYKLAARQMVGEYEWSAMSGSMIFLMFMFPTLTVSFSSINLVVEIII